MEFDSSESFFISGIDLFHHISSTMVSKVFVMQYFLQELLNFLVWCMIDNPLLVH